MLIKKQKHASTNPKKKVLIFFKKEVLLSVFSRQFFLNLHFYSSTSLLTPIFLHIAYVEVPLMGRFTVSGHLPVMIDSFKIVTVAVLSNVRLRATMKSTKAYFVLSTPSICFPTLSLSILPSSFS
eukprot:TRINITY_DN84284_c0_g1_i1.p1 TRINITY_DN84284_c0_g1~~TRINITY_DN84284_c0_g1_i1.p1  ORF type:complete len:125 (+),score=4.22 TRINITY_DN84284_c0_g1_i1:83-457(+)